MEKETAKELLEAMKDAADIAISAQDRITALESLLKSHRPDLYLEYQERLREQKPTTPFDPAAFSSLVEKLTRH
jgi:hypothetical protein